MERPGSPWKQQEADGSSSCLAPLLPAVVLGLRGLQAGATLRGSPQPWPDQQQAWSQSLDALEGR